MPFFKRKQPSAADLQWAADRKAALYDTDALERIAAGVVDRGHLDQEMVQGYINAARQDCYANTLTLLSAQLNQGTLYRQMSRYRAVTGFTERLRVGGMELGMSSFAGIALAGLGIWSTGWPWWLPCLLGAGFAALVYMVFQIRDAYRRCFARAMVIERASFCFPDEATSLLRTNLPRLAAYNRPELWNGPNARNGVFDPESFLVYQTGAAEPIWELDDQGALPDLVGDAWDPNDQREDAPTEEEQEQYNQYCLREVACEIKWGRPAIELTHPSMIFDLPADFHRAHTAVMKDRRSWHRRLQQAGLALRLARLQNEGVLDGNWQLIVFIACVILGLLVLMLGGGGTAV